MRLEPCARIHQLRDLPSTAACEGASTKLFRLQSASEAFLPSPPTCAPRLRRKSARLRFFDGIGNSDEPSKTHASCSTTFSAAIVVSKSAKSWWFTTSSSVCVTASTYCAGPDASTAATIDPCSFADRKASSGAPNGTQSDNPQPLLPPQGSLLDFVEIRWRRRAGGVRVLPSMHKYLRRHIVQH